MTDDLTAEAKAEISAAIAIVREDKFSKYARTVLKGHAPVPPADPPKDPPTDPPKKDGPEPPPAKDPPNDPPPKPKRGLWWPPEGDSE